MTNDSENFTDAPHPRRRTIFDPTINLGHVLTFVGFMAAGFSAYSTLDKRVSIMESKSVISESYVQEQGKRMKETLSEIKADVKDLQRSVNDVNRNLNK